MSEKNVIHEITMQMSNGSVVQNDMNEATELVMQMFKDKYFNKLSSAISEHQDRCRKNPSKEVQLLHAFKPFLPDGEKEKMDQLVQFMLLRDTAESVKKELGAGMNLAAAQQTPVTAAAQQPPASIHEDGIYEVDQVCLIKKKQEPAGFPGLLLMMALQYMSNR